MFLGYSPFDIISLKTREMTTKRIQSSFLFVIDFYILCTCVNVEIIFIHVTCNLSF